MAASVLYATLYPYLFGYSSLTEVCGLVVGEFQIDINNGTVRCVVLQILSFFFVEKGHAAEATDAPQP